MSKLEELLKKYCSNEVGYKALSDVVKVHRGKRVVRDQLPEDGKYVVYQNALAPLGFINEYNFMGGTTFVIGAGAAGEIGYSYEDFWAADDCYPLVCSDSLMDRYVYYFVMKQKPYIMTQVRRGSIPRLSRNVIERLSIPVPPLPVQAEIVRILDNFTELTSELISKLTAELSARKQQYEYYRDSIIANAESAPRVRIKEIAEDIYRGSGIKRDEITKEGVPCVRYGEIYTQYDVWFDKCASYTNLESVASPKFFDHGDILFAITGESIEDIAKCTAYIGHDTCLAGGDIVVLKHKQNPKYLSYALSTLDAQAQKGKGKVKSKVVHSSVPAILDLEIPLPSIEEQNRIANMLDNYYSLLSDINTEISAEITTRQKQYEYYRDTLLSF